ncbi:MAG: hypothetical protein JETCAE01_29080 [Anaerolineaceae bacterium]|nr:MAG: hypothetical protein JETCAE01_29080 [Anaerolineaceae bacterium]
MFMDRLIVLQVENDHSTVWKVTAQAFSQGNAIHAKELDVRQDNIRLEYTYQLHGFPTITCFTYHNEIPFGIEPHAQPLRILASSSTIRILIMPIVY